MKGELLLTREAVLVRYQIPHALASPILDDLVACGLLIDTPEGYLPARSAEELRISDCITALETKGASDFPFIDAKSLAPFERALKTFQAQIESSPDNKLIYLRSE